MNKLFWITSSETHNRQYAIFEDGKQILEIIKLEKNRYFLFLNYELQRTFKTLSSAKKKAEMIYDKHINFQSRKTKEEMLIEAVEYALNHSTNKQEIDYYKKALDYV